ncbi:DNA-dependent RNA polymerase II, partial [Coemansia nantahalensis]
MADDSYYGDEAGYDGDEYGFDKDEADLITQEDYWTLISRYFDEHGLVRQQINSFNDFIEHSLQEIVDENPNIVMQNTYQGDQGQDIAKRYHLAFGQVYISTPSFTEKDGAAHLLHPQEARLRNLTYWGQLHLQSGQRTLLADSSDPRNKGITGIPDMAMDVIDGHKFFDRDGNLISTTSEFVGRIPMMLRSQYCNLHGMNSQQLFELGECPYDQGGYFVINGSEKVLIAQERIATNTVLVFKKSPPHSYYTAEIRSQAERVSKVASPLLLKLTHKPADKSGSQLLLAKIPYIHCDIEAIIIFRALGMVTAKDIMEHIAYDPSDTQMMDMLKPSLEDAFVIQDREIALDYI